MANQREKKYKQHTLFHERFLGIVSSPIIIQQKYKYGSPHKHFVKVGEIHKSQNINKSDCSKIIQQMRYNLKRRDEEMRLKATITDGDILRSIKDLGYKSEEVERDVKILNTPISNLYRILLAEKEDEKAKENNYLNFYSRSPKNSLKVKEVELKEKSKGNLILLSIIGRIKVYQNSTLEKMSGVLEKLKDPNYKPRYRRIKFKQKCSNMMNKTSH
jgi:hypothetical protein